MKKLKGLRIILIWITWQCMLSNSWKTRSRELVDKQIKSFFSSKFAVNNVEIEDKETKCISLPYLGYFSYQLRNTMLNLLRKHFPNVNFRFILWIGALGSLFRVKDPVPITLCSSIVYCFKCSDCTSRYMDWNLKIRIVEHRGISYRTDTPITRPGFSRIREHALSCNHSINEQDFSIKFRANCLPDLRIAESLMIMKQKPDINGTALATRLMIFS